MGCGSSSLKGEKVNDVEGGSEMPAAKRVRTNFSEVDFNSGAAADRRGTMALAPDEQRRPTKISEASVDMPTSPAKSKISTDRQHEQHVEGSKLEPYKSIDASDNNVVNTSALMQKTEATPEITTNSSSAH